MPRSHMHFLSDLIFGKRRFLTLFSLILAGMMLLAALPLGEKTNVEAVYSGDPDSTLFYDYDQLVDRLNHIETVSEGDVELEVLGESNQGRNIYMATVGTGETPVMIFTQQHGNEPHGTQGALNLLEDLGTSDNPEILHILEELTVHIVPRLNPDGSEPGVFTRHNADPLAPPGNNTAEGRYCSYRVGWDLNRYFAYDWSTHPLSEYSEFSIMTDEFGLLIGRTFNGSVPHNDEQGILVDCGKGNEPADFPAEVAGNIALMERNGTFNDKGANAQAAGAIGMILYQEDPDATTIPRLNLSDPPDIPATVISRQSALEIIDHPGPVTGQFVTNTHEENPATEAVILMDAVQEIEPVWIIDSHNQGSFISPAGKTVTSSIMWATNEDACPDAVDVARQVCVAMVDHMEQFPEAELTQYPGGDFLGIARNGFAVEGIPCILMEHWNNYRNLRIAEVLVNHTYEQMFAAIQATADGTLFAIDPSRADDIQSRGSSTTTVNAEETIEPYLPVYDEWTQEAIDEAIEAIDNIPDPITIYDMMEIRIARSRIEMALELEAAEEDITNLDIFLAAEAEINDLYRDNYMKQSLFELPVPRPEYVGDWNVFIRNKHERWSIYPRTVNGVEFLPELGTLSYAYSDVTEPRWAEYDIGGRGYSHVKGYAGITDQDSRTDFPITFQIHGDGDLIFEAILEYGEHAEFYLLEVDGIDSLRFGYYAEVTDGTSANRAIFVEPQFLIPINDDMLDAMDDAEAAIAALPETVSLMDEEQVQAARSVVEEAFALGVEKEGRIANLDKLIAAEEAIHGFYHQFYEIESLVELGDPGSDNRNQAWFSDFEGYWEVHEEGHLRSLNRRYFEPLKFYSSSHSPIENQPRWAQWDISEKGYSYVEGYLGISDSSLVMAFPLTFTIYGDGEPLFEALLEYGRDAIFYRLDLEGVDMIRFEWDAAETDDGTANRPCFIEPLFLHSPKTAEAITLAEDAIDDLPDLADLTLEDKADVLAARAAVSNALAIGVPEGDITNLGDLLAAEGKIADLEGDILFGDVDGNGIINVADVILLLRHITGLIDLELLYGPEALIRAKITGGTEPPDITDAVMIMRKVLGMD